VESEHFEGLGGNGDAGGAVGWELGFLRIGSIIVLVSWPCNLQSCM
jgi:hypothetical protein